MTELPTECDLLDDAPRYVAEAFKVTEPNWVKRDDLVDNYVRPKPNNLSGLRDDIRSDLNQPDGKLDDYDINGWLIDRAITEIGFQNVIEHDEAEDAYRMADGVFADTLKLGDELLIQKSSLPDLFTPETGVWASNIRDAELKDSDAKDKELRESMKAHGWLSSLPAIQDENGVLITGHRRLAVAEELGLDRNIKTIHFGDGPKGEAARAALAIASNVGAKPLSPADRKKIAADLYGDGTKFSMTEIAELLKVSAMTVSRDLGGLTDVKPPKQKGGRPSKPKPEPTPETTIVVPKASGFADAIADMISAQMDAAEAAKDDESAEITPTLPTPDPEPIHPGPWLGTILSSLTEFGDWVESLDDDHRVRFAEHRVFAEMLAEINQQVQRTLKIVAGAGEQAVEVHGDDANVERVAKGIVRWLNKHDRGTRGAIRKSFSAPDRQYFEPALERLVQDGSVAVADDGEIELGAGEPK